MPSSEQYWKTSLYKAAKKLNQLETAEEIVQDVFIDLWNQESIIGDKISQCLHPGSGKVPGGQCRVKANRYNSLITTSIKEDSLQTEHPPGSRN